MARNPSRVMTLGTRLIACIGQIIDSDSPTSSSMKSSLRCKEFKMLTDELKHEMNLDEAELSKNIQSSRQMRIALKAEKIISAEFPVLERVYEGLGKRVALARFNHCKSLVALSNDARAGGDVDEEEASILTASSCSCGKTE